MLIKSKYTVVYPTEDGKLVYNTKNGAQIFIEKDDAVHSNEISKLENDDCCDIENEVIKKLFCIQDSYDEVTEVIASYYKNMFDPNNE